MESPEDQLVGSPSHRAINVGAVAFAAFALLSFAVSLINGIIPIYLLEGVGWICLALYWYVKNPRSELLSVIILILAAGVFAANGYGIGRAVGAKEGIQAGWNAGYGSAYKAGVRKGYNVGYAIGGAEGYWSASDCAKGGGFVKNMTAQTPPTGEFTSTTEYKCGMALVYAGAKLQVDPYKDEVLSIIRGAEHLEKSADGSMVLREDPLPDKKQSIQDAFANHPTTEGKR